MCVSFCISLPLSPTLSRSLFVSHSARRTSLTPLRVRILHGSCVCFISVSYAHSPLIFCRWARLLSLIHPFRSRYRHIAHTHTLCRTGTVECIQSMYVPFIHSAILFAFWLLNGETQICNSLESLRLSVHEMILFFLGHLFFYLFIYFFVSFFGRLSRCCCCFFAFSLFLLLNLVILQINGIDGKAHKTQDQQKTSIKANSNTQTH